MGETSRLLEARVKEHLSRNSSAVHGHCKLTGHSVDSTAKEKFSPRRVIRRIREAIEIRLRNPSLNREDGFELASIYDTILAPLRDHYITLLNSQICIVADEDRWIRTKDSTFEFLTCALSTEVIYIFYSFK